ncbi:MAG: PLP-dependent transferase [Planctomycetota bacterium]
MAEHGRRALEIARRLEARGLEVVYPGLESHPQHALLNELSNPGYGAGGLLGLVLADEQIAMKLMELLQNRHRFGYMAVSLGYHDTLMSCSAASTSSELSDEDLAAAGIARGLVRMSIGYTGSLEQRWSQLSSALDELGIG